MSKLGDNAATNSTVATLVGAVEALRQDVLNQATDITGLSSTIVRLETTVEEQDRTVAMLQANAVRQETAIEGQVEGLDGIRATLQTNATSQAAGIAQLADADVMHADAIAALQANSTSQAADIAAVYEAAIAELRSDFLNLIERLAVAEETVAVADGRVDRLNETAVRSTQFGSRSQWPDSLTVRGAGQAGYPNDFFRDAAITLALDIGSFNNLRNVSGGLSLLATGMQELDQFDSLESVVEVRVGYNEKLVTLAGFSRLCRRTPPTSERPFRSMVAFRSVVIIAAI